MKKILIDFIIKFIRLILVCGSSWLISSWFNLGIAGYAACLAGIAYVEALDKK